MNYKAFQKLMKTELKDVFPITEIQSFYSILLQHYAGLSRFQAVSLKDEKIPELILNKLKKALLRLKNNEPIQYITGITYFFDTEIFVNKHTLIPRPETEELVSIVLQKIKQHKNFAQKRELNILDLCTGSGCIAIALANSLQNAKVYAIDVSAHALEMASKNAKHNQVNVVFKKADVLEMSSLSVKFDVVISNPPYVQHAEKAKMNKNVLDFEPHLALFVEDTDPLLFYRKIVELAKSSLKAEGFLFFEINQYLAREMENMFLNFGVNNFSIKKDLFQKDRFAICQF